MNPTLLLLAGLLGLAAAATVAPTMAPDMGTTAAAVCGDDPKADCWSRPDADCFGIYEPWSRQHCPSRCGFCTDMAPCVDKITYCDRLEDNICTEASYAVYSRNNCRKHCNWCDRPTRPPGMTTMPTLPNQGGGGSSQGTASPGGTGMTGGTTVPMPAVNTTMVMPTTHDKPHAIPGTVGRAEQSTILIKGPAASSPGKCLYHGTEYDLGKRWYDGCTYTCSCINADLNLVVCAERCNRWILDDGVTFCKMTPEDNECCARLECS